MARCFKGWGSCCGKLMLQLLKVVRALCHCALPGSWQHAYVSHHEASGLQREMSWLCTERHTTFSAMGKSNRGLLCTFDG